MNDSVKEMFKKWIHVVAHEKDRVNSGCCCVRFVIPKADQIWNKNPTNATVHKNKRSKAKTWRKRQSSDKIRRSQGNAEAITRTHECTLQADTPTNYRTTSEFKKPLQKWSEIKEITSTKFYEGEKALLGYETQVKSTKRAPTDIKDNVYHGQEMDCPRHFRIGLKTLHLFTQILSCFAQLLLQIEFACLLHSSTSFMV